MKAGARNKLVGEVTGIKLGQLMGQATVKITEPAIMESVMTLDSLADLELKEGDKVMVMVKAVNVLILKNNIAT